MYTHRWLSLAVIAQFLFFVVTAAPHTVHHGLHDGGSQGCPISTVTTQTNGELPDILPLPSPLLLIDALPTLDLFLPERFARQVYRSRAPPLSLPA
ncbi:MAG: hypothetical protein ACE5JQ_02280 [Candidatus Methylomirabilales bacterium]